MSDVDQIMVAEGSESSPGTEDVTLESVTPESSGFDPDSLSTSTNDTVDADLFITKESGTWVKKAASYVWNYIKTKLGISNSGSTFLRKDGTWATPTDTTYNVVSTSENGLAPKVTNTSGYLKGDGTWSVPSGGETYTDFTYNKHGLVPNPGGSAKNTNHYLFDDGSWGWVENQTVDFSTGDSTDSAATSWTSVSKVTSGSSLGTLMQRISQMMKNTRYLYNNSMVIVKNRSFTTDSGGWLTPTNSSGSNLTSKNCYGIVFMHASNSSTSSFVTNYYTFWKFMFNSAGNSRIQCIHATTGNAITSTSVTVTYGYIPK